MDIAMVNPHQLVPTMGQLRVGAMTSAASSSLIHDFSACGKQIHFGSLDFTPH
jgi:hypothetical protein